VGSCNRGKRGVYAMKREGISPVERRKRGSQRIREGAVEEGIHSAVEVTANGAGVLCGEKGW